MKATYKTAFHAPDGTTLEGESRTNTLPFTRVSARAIIVRRRDGSINRSALSLRPNAP